MTAHQGRQAKYKGSAYELKISKILSKNFNDNVQRVPLSGAWRGSDVVQNYHNDNRFIGDLFVPKNSPLGIFNFELKNHAGVKLSHLFNNSGEIPSFLQQCLGDSYKIGGECHTVPCLIIHVTREDDYVILPYSKLVFSKLTANKLPVMLKRMFFQDERTLMLYEYDMLILNLTGFCSLDKEVLYKEYVNKRWDHLNENKKKKKFDIDVDKIVKGVD